MIATVVSTLYKDLAVHVAILNRYRMDSTQCRNIHNLEFNDIAKITKTTKTTKKWPLGYISNAGLVNATRARAHLLTHPKGNVSNPSIVRFSLIVDLILRDMCVVTMSFVLVSHLNWKRSFD